jgi:AraC-like DNA-binding protein
MVQKIMLSSPLGQLNEEGIAAELFINKRTLARRLKKEGTSFRELRDEILSQQAADYLIKDDLSIDAIAMLLNYHDGSNFRRAFKRWFGMSPDEFRKSKFK